ncbi:MAG: choice-of-anchor D domain-containing protein [Haloarculaceae archaeon]
MLAVTTTFTGAMAAGNVTRVYPENLVINEPGTYVLASGTANSYVTPTITITASNVTLYGSGEVIDGRTTSDDDGTGIYITGGDNGIENVEIHGVTVQDFERGIVVSNANDTRIVDSTVTTPDGDGIVLQGYDTNGQTLGNVTITGSKINNPGDIGVDATHTPNLTITDTTVGLTGDDGMELDDAENTTMRNVSVTGAGYAGVDGSDVDNSTFVEITVEASDDDGMELDYAEHTTVRNVTFDSPGYIGLDGDEMDDSTIHNVTVTDGGDDGLEIDDSSDASITNVTLRTVDYIGLQLDAVANLTLAHVSMTGVGDDGVEIYGAPNSTMRNLTVETTADGWIGVDVDEARNASLADVHVIYADDDGVELDEMVDATVTNVTVDDADYEGFSLDDSDGAVVANVTVGSAHEVGIDFDDNPNATLRGFRVTSVDDADAMYLDADGATIENGTLSDGNRRGIDISTTTDAVLRNVTVRNMSEEGIHAEGSPSTTENTTFERVAALNNTRQGISLHGYDDVHLRNVNASDNGKQGIEIANSDGLQIDDSVTNDNAVGIFLGRPEIGPIRVTRIRSHAATGNERAAFTTNEGDSTQFVNNTVSDMTVGDVRTSFVADDANVSRALAPTPPSDWYDTGVAVALSEADSADGSFVDLTMHYDDGDVSNLDESTLSLWRYDDGTWSEVTDAVDTDANSVSANLTTFGTIAVLADDRTSTSGGGGDNEGTATSTPTPTSTPTATPTPTPTPTPVPGVPNVSVASSVSFGRVDVDAGATARTLTVTNVGDGTLTVSDTTVTGIDADLFDVASGTLRVDPGDSESLRVSYDPDGPATHAATLQLTTDDPGRPTATVALSGTGGQSNPALDAAEYGFDDVTRNTVATTNVTVTNDGTAPATVTNVSVRGPNADQFAAPNVSFRIAAGDRRTIPVQYAPTALGAHEATLRVETGNGRLIARLDGHGVAPELVTEPTDADFGIVTLGSRREVTVTVRNEGETAAALSGVTVAGDDADQFVVVNGSAVEAVPAGATHDVTVAFRPTQSGESRARLQVLNDRGVPVAGTLLNGSVERPDVKVTPRSLTFENATVNETVTRRVTVANHGNGTLTVASTRIIGSRDGFSIPTDTPLEVAPGGTRTLSVAFAPTTPEARTATLALATNDPTDRQVPVALSSTAATLNISLNTTANTTTANVTATNVSAGSTVSAGVPQGDTTTTDSVAVEEVSITAERGGNFSMNVTEGTDPLQSSPAFNDTKHGQDLSYLSVDHSISNDNISQAQVTFRVNKSRLDAMQSEPDDMRMYRYVNGTWTSEPTTFENETDSEYVFSATAPGLSEWTTAARVPRINVTDAKANVTAATTDDAVTIDVLLTNTGGSDGLFVTKLLLNDTVVDRRESTVAPNSTSLVFFERRFDQPGDYAVQVNDVFVAVVDVSQADRSVDVDRKTTAVEGVDSGSTNGGSTTATTTSSGGGPLSPTVALASILFVGLWLAAGRTRRE